jgi:hypothetical protein
MAKLKIVEEKVKRTVDAGQNTVSERLWTAEQQADCHLNAAQKRIGQLKSVSAGEGEK